MAENGFIDALGRNIKASITEIIQGMSVQVVSTSTKKDVATEATLSEINSLLNKIDERGLKIEEESVRKFADAVLEVVKKRRSKESGSDKSEQSSSKESDKSGRDKRPKDKKENQERKKDPIEILSDSMGDIGNPNSGRWKRITKSLYYGFSGAFSQVANNLKLSLEDMIPSYQEANNFRERMREIVYETKGFGRLNRQTEDAFFKGVKSAVHSTGTTAEKFYDEYRKNVERGMNLISDQEKAQMEVIGKTGRRKLSMEEKSQKITEIQARRTRDITATALFTGKQLKMDMSSMSEMFTDWHMQLALSTSEVASMSRHMQSVAHATGVTGERLEKSIKSADALVKNFQKAGSYSVDTHKAVQGMMVAMDKYGVGEELASSMSALTGIEAFLASDSKIQQFWSRAAVMGQKNYKGNLYERTISGGITDDPEAFAALQEGRRAAFRDALRGFEDVLGPIKDLDLTKLDKTLENLRKTGRATEAGQIAYKFKLLQGQDIGTAIQQEKGYQEIEKANRPLQVRLKELTDSIEQQKLAKSQGKINNFDELQRKKLQLESEQYLEGLRITTDKTLSPQAQATSMKHLFGNQSFGRDRASVETALKKFSEQAKAQGGNFDKALKERGTTQEELIKAFTEGTPDQSEQALSAIQEAMQRGATKEKAAEDILTDIRQEIVDWKNESMGWSFSMLKMLGGNDTLFGKFFSTVAKPLYFLQRIGPTLLTIGTAIGSFAKVKDFLKGMKEKHPGTSGGIAGPSPSNPPKPPETPSPSNPPETPETPSPSKRKRKKKTIEDDPKRNEHWQTIMNEMFPGEPEPREYKKGNAANLKKTYSWDKDVKRFEKEQAAKKSEGGTGWGAKIGGMLKYMPKMKGKLAWINSLTKNADAIGAGIGATVGAGATYYNTGDIKASAQNAVLGGAAGYGVGRVVKGVGGNVEGIVGKVGDLVASATSPTEEVTASLENIEDPIPVEVKNIAEFGTGGGTGGEFGIDSILDPKAIFDKGKSLIKETLGIKDDSMLGKAFDTLSDGFEGKVTEKIGEITGKLKSKLGLPAGGGGGGGGGAASSVSSGASGAASSVPPAPSVPNTPAPSVSSAGASSTSKTLSAGDKAASKLASKGSKGLLAEMRGITNPENIAKASGKSGGFLSRMGGMLSKNFPTFKKLGSWFGEKAGNWAPKVLRSGGPGLAKVISKATPAIGAIIELISLKGKIQDIAKQKNTSPEDIYQQMGTAVLKSGLGFLGGTAAAMLISAPQALGIPSWIMAPFMYYVGDKAGQWLGDIIGKYVPLGTLGKWTADAFSAMGAIKNPGDLPKVTATTTPGAAVTKPKTNYSGALGSPADFGMPNQFPAMEVGSRSVVKGGLAELHQGEIVVPKETWNNIQATSAGPFKKDRFEELTGMSRDEFSKRNNDKSPLWAWGGIDLVGGLIEKLRNAFDNKPSSKEKQNAISELNRTATETPAKAGEVKSNLMDYRDQDVGVKPSLMDYRDEVKASVNPVLPNGTTEQRVEQRKFAEKSKTSSTPMEAITDYLTNIQAGKLDDMVTELREIRKIISINKNAPQIIGPNQPKRTSTKQPGIKNIAFTKLSGAIDMTFADVQPGAVTTNGRAW